MPYRALMCVRWCVARAAACTGRRVSTVQWREIGPPVKSHVPCEAVSALYAPWSAPGPLPWGGGYGFLSLDASDARRHGRVCVLCGGMCVCVFGCGTILTNSDGGDTSRACTRWMAENIDIVFAHELHYQVS